MAKPGSSALDTVERVREEEPKTPVVRQTSEVTERTDAGDHTVFFGRVLDATAEREAPPLLFYQGKYGKLGSG